MVEIHKLGLTKKIADDFMRALLQDGFQEGDVNHQSSGELREAISAESLKARVKVGDSLHLDFSSSELSSESKKSASAMIEDFEAMRAPGKRYYDEEEVLEARGISKKEVSTKAKELGKAITTSVVVGETVECIKGIATTTLEMDKDHYKPYRGCWRKLIILVVTTTVRMERVCLQGGD